ncbi:hypothetical protein D7I47_08425 [Protaetiibacter intestinalis]|uniref:QsdR TetR regulatory C-terminal domain-containing protein n=2 Tax=Protaetiibacter intestinalis TaxID=2419774 RepID=A0A387BLV4_9MICO|nr:hypothetical protein D7I47_08425 [Protaetiibacter intestinalis]
MTPAEPGVGSRATRLVPSALSARLHGEVPHRDAARAFQLARRAFLAGERIEMGPLAAELGVDRTSLFRWVGNRDALLAEVLWSLAQASLDHAEEQATGEGAERVVDVLGRFADGLVTAPYFRDFLAREPQRALRLMTTGESEIQRRYVAAVEELLATHAPEAGRPALPRHDLAYLIVRISETFSYADLIAGEEPSAERARAAFALVLGA